MAAAAAAALLRRLRRRREAGQSTSAPSSAKPAGAFALTAREQTARRCPAASAILREAYEKATPQLVGPGQAASRRAAPRRPAGCPAGRQTSERAQLAPASLALRSWVVRCCLRTVAARRTPVPPPLWPLERVAALAPGSSQWFFLMHYSYFRSSAWKGGVYWNL